MIALPDTVTPRLRRAVALAEETAGRDNRPARPEDLLLGLLAEGTGAASLVLARLGVDRSALEAALTAHVQEAPAGAPDRRGPPPARAMIARAEQEASERGHHYLGQEHLLLGLLREPDSAVARELAPFGVTYDRVVTAFNAIFS